MKQFINLKHIRCETIINLFSKRITSLVRKISAFAEDISVLGFENLFVSNLKLIYYE
jgi:hypothetical protein